MPRRQSLDALEAEIRATRSRLAALLARADRDYALRAILRALQRGAGYDELAPAAPEAPPEADPAAPEPVREAGRLGLPAAMLGFALAVVALDRLRPRGADGSEK